MAKEKTITTIDGRQLALSNLDKPLYPDGTTKAQVIDYCVKISPVLLPHLKDRPLSLKRFPDGSGEGGFFEKNCPRFHPDWFQVEEVPSGAAGNTIRFCVANDLPSLVWLANLATLELHTYLHAAQDPDRPTMVVFDFDPGEPAGVRESAQIALAVRDMLGEIGLDAYAKSSGKKGIHMAVPLNTTATYDDTKAFARAVAATLAEKLPKRVTDNMSKAKRAGKVFIDWSQNTLSKTTICAYSLRAADRPTVSAPLTWNEVRSIAEGKNVGVPFDSQQTLARVDEMGDLWKKVLTQKQKLPRGIDKG